MTVNLKNLFGLSKAPVDATGQISQNQANSYNQDGIQNGETYVAYGRRMCGRVTASVQALNPLLHRVYCHEKQRQRDDEQLQSEYRQRLHDEISDLDRRIGINDVEQNGVRANIGEKESEKLDIQERLNNAKGRIGQANKMARIKMILGMVILAVLTVYLFMFYSSTFYSAFFKDLDVTSDNLLSQAMFDSKALPMAMKKGFGALMFVTCAPIIFMGLGYMLHFYSVEKGKAKYLKIGATVAITFIFDCILAVQIAKKIYEAYIMTMPGDFEPFGMKMAVTDLNVWAVIFCGFIAYMIWGFVFDLTISAYEDMKTNRNEIQSLMNEIRCVDEQKKNLNETLNGLEREKVSLVTKRNAKEYRLSQQNFIWDESVIRLAMVEFFSGWISVMNPLGHSAEAQQQCREVYEQTVNQLITNE